MNSWIVTNLWLIPAIPLAASLLILSLANSRRRRAPLSRSSASSSPSLSRSRRSCPRCKNRAGAPSQFYQVHFRRTRVAPRRVHRSAHRRDAAHDHVRRSVDFRLQHWLHGGRQKLLPVLRVSFLLFRRDARRGRREQFAPSLASAGNWSGLASYLLIGFLDSQTERSAAAKKKLSSPPASATSDCSLRMLWLYGSSGTLLFTTMEMAASKNRTPRARRQRDLCRAAHLLWRCRQVRPVPAPRLVAGRDGRSHAS